MCLPGNRVVATSFYYTFLVDQGTVLSHTYTHTEVSTIISPISQMSPLRYRETEEFTQVTQL